MSETNAAPKHPYHLVDPSPWPIIGAVAAGFLTGGGVLYMHGHGWALLIVGLVSVLAIMAVWWRDLIREATFQGHHTPVVPIGFRHRMAVFLPSRVMVFSACFLAFFSSSLFPARGGWPPPTIPPFHPAQHLGFEAAAWYWHCVGVVWLFLFVCVYGWGEGSGGAGPAG